MDSARIILQRDNKQHLIFNTNTAIAEYEALKRLSQGALLHWKRQQYHETVLIYESLIPGICDWLDKYKHHIQTVTTPGYPNSWMMKLEDMKTYWLFQFKLLLQSQQIEHPLRSVAGKIQEEIDQFLNKYFYL